MITGELNPLALEAASLFKALAHPARLAICCQLRKGEMSVGDMETRLGIRQPRLSRELAKLREDGLLTTRRESKVIFYRLADDHPKLASMIDAICMVMLDQPAPQSVPVPAQKFRPNSPGGYGVFSRTNLNNGSPQ